MAADTRGKRFSIMGMKGSPLRGTMIPIFDVDGSVDLDDRQHLLGTYGGIAFSQGIGGLLLLPHEMRAGMNRLAGGFTT